MSRPSKSPTWATDANYSSGVDSGTPTRVDPGAGYRGQGFLPNEEVPAPVVNHALGVHGDWLQYLADIDWLNWQVINASNFTSDTLNVGSPVAMGKRSTEAAAFSDGLLAAPTDGNGVIYSGDGINWGKSNPLSYLASDQVKAIFYSTIASLWILPGAAGSTTKIQTVNNMGGTWVARTDPGSDFTRRAITEGAGIIVMCRGGGGFLTSTNGTTWTERTHPATVKDLWGVCYGAGKFVAVGGLAGSPFTPVVLTSTDGITWTDQSSGLPAGYVAGGKRLVDVAYDSTLSLFVAVGASGAVCTSPDGVTWTDKTPASYSGNFFRSVVTDGGTIYVCTGNGNKILIRSTDGGGTWTGQKLGWLSTEKGIFHGAGRLVAFGVGYPADLVGIGLGFRAALY